MLVESGGMRGSWFFLKSQIEIPDTCVELILRKRIVYKVYPNTLFSELTKSILDLRASSQSISKHANSDRSRRSFSPKQEFKNLKIA
ncbi:hypothetical protein BCON_0066g00020 [Botryotinia convoluta]|uniref:Uncharacterized protein n=1 Tax=Botryotinia convoluta TaxID=54673 RepID=A0A4Z1I9K2_9HELO|nr:hypothetical protein BCON_0066g00020 [Botryotinia convoluta]